MNIGTRREHSVDQIMERLAIGFDLAFKCELVSGQQNSAAVIPQISIYNNFVADLGPRGRDINASRDNTNARCVDKQLVGRSAFDNFCVAGDYSHARRIGHLAHCRGNSPKRNDRQAFFQNHSA